MEIFIDIQKHYLEVRAAGINVTAAMKIHKCGKEVSIWRHACTLVYSGTVQRQTDSRYFHGDHLKRFIARTGLFSTFRGI